MAEVTITIPARNEIHLNQTIQSILDTATGDCEIVVGLDGWTIPYEKVNHPLVRYIEVKDAIGRRVMGNLLAKEAKGKYLVKCDAHIIIKTHGWTELMMDACLENTMVGCVVDMIDEATWTPKGRKLLCNEVITPEYRTQWWVTMIPKPWKPVEEIICFSAVCCMIQTETFWKYGGHREDFGHWGHEELEWALKLNTNEGKVLCRTDVEVAHLYRKKFPYSFTSQIERDRETLKQDYPMQMLEQIISRFRKYGPVPGWDRLTFGSGTITRSDWAALKEVITSRKITHVAEFGAGLSTTLLDTLCDVDSFETEDEWIAKVQSKVKRTSIHKWDGKTAQGLPDCGLALIDGPFGGQNREAAYLSVARSNIPIVACHDADRNADRHFITRYFGTWTPIAQTKQLLILHRPKYALFELTPSYQQAVSDTIVSEEEYYQRHAACKACGATLGMCVFCKCTIPTIGYLAKSRSCPMPQTRRGLPSYPAKNFWAEIGKKQ